MSQTHILITNPWPLNSSSNCILNEEYLEQKDEMTADTVAQIAENELRENAHTRSECLYQFKEWIKKHPDIVNCLLDDNFLLRFLRVKKFSIPMAQQTLLKYLNFRKRFKYIMHNLDCLDPAVDEIISNGYMFVSPYRDGNGRRVIIYNIGKFDTKKFTSRDMARVHVITYETLMDDEVSQILGVNHIGDGSGANASIVSMWNVNEFGTLVKWGEQSFPMRHKEMNGVNFPHPFKYVYEFVVALASQKLKERVVIHDTIDDLHTRVHKRCLPQEYGGVMPASEMIKMWREELQSKRERLLSYDVMDLLSDKDIITRRKKQQDNFGQDSLPGSFRKLEVD